MSSPPLPDPPIEACPECGYLACVCAPLQDPEGIDWAATETGPPPSVGVGVELVDWVERRAVELCAHGTHPIPCHLHVRQASLQAEAGRADLVRWG